MATKKLMTEEECIAYVMHELDVSHGMALSMLRQAIRNGELPAVAIDEHGNAILVDPETVKGVQ